MARPTIYRFARGETIVLAQDVVSGVAADVTSQVAKMRPLPAGKYVLEADAEVAAEFTVTYRAASGEVAEGWDLTVPDTVSKDLAVGDYLVDSRKVIGSGVVTDDPVVVQIYEPATVTAGSGVP